jgi:hypothetical protein
LAAAFGVVTPMSIVLGKIGINLDFFNKICMFSVAGSVGIWGATNVLLPAVKTFMPEEYAMMMCFIKYRGSMQICVAQNQTVQYQKEGSYETLKMDLGAVTPSQTIPPPNPVPDTWSSNYPYDFPFTLSNENTVGTTYDISIPKDGITVSASPYDDGRDSKSAAMITDMPNYPINPGGYVVVTAKFEEPFYQGRLENCKQYTYFKINISTEQIGGGSSKFGIIESDDGYDNQNFMYFFNPDVKTEPGPLDIYTYTLPFVVAYSQAKKIGPDKPHFGVYIKIKNKGSGTAFFDNITLIQTSDTNPFDISNCVLMENSLLFNKGINSNTYCSSGKNGNCIYISPVQRDNATLEKNGEWTFRCNGKIKDINNPSNSFIGKVTGLMSVVANYEYLQKYDEQIACIKNEEYVNSLCIVLNETECSGTSICHYCKECDGTKLAQHTNQCVSVNTDCGYSCVMGQCGADCSPGSNLPNAGCTQERPYCTQDCRCFYPII